MSFRLSFLTALFCIALSGAAQAQWSSAPAPEGWTTQPTPPPANAPAPEGWGERPPVTAAGGGDGSSRLLRLEEQLRSLNGQIEQLQFQNRSLQEQLRKVQEDAEFRFQELEGGKKPGASARPARMQAAPPSAVPDENVEVLSTKPQLGAPPRNLGQLPADASGAPVDLSPTPGAAAGQPLEPLPGTEPRPTFTPSSKAAVSAGSDSPEDQYDLAYGYMLRGDYEMADSAFRDFLTDFPTHKNASKAQYWLGEAQYQRKQYKAAAESFLKVYNNHPDSEKAPESLLRLGMSLHALGQKDAACATFAEVGNKFPKSSQAVKKRVQTEQKTAGC